MLCPACAQGRPSGVFAAAGDDRSWFERVTPTQEEVDAHKAKFGRSPATYRYRCKRCDTRLWGSGLGIGSHVRKHRREDAQQQREGALAARQQEGDERAFGDYTMRYGTSDQGERKPRHVITTYHGDKKVGELNWFGTTGMVHHVDVEPDHARHGVATAMWQWGQEMTPKPKHSSERTTQGDAWARSVGGPLPRRKQGSMEREAATPLNVSWEQFGEATPHRPASWRLTGDMMLTVAVSPVTTPANPDWKSLPGSLQWQGDTQAFNENVGWKVAHWHWSVVRGGGVVGAGDEPTEEAAKAAAMAAIPADRAKRYVQSSLISLAHDSGDGFTIMHCPFCGSGMVIARGDGSAECAYCNQVFTVQVQPFYPGLPQSDPNVPLFGGDHPAPGEEPDVPAEEADDASNGAGEAENKAQASRRYITSTGVALDHNAFIFRLAMQHADVPELVVSARRREAATGRPDQQWNLFGEEWQGLPRYKVHFSASRPEWHEGVNRVLDEYKKRGREVLSGPTHGTCTASDLAHHDCNEVIVEGRDNANLLHGLGSAIIPGAVHYENYDVNHQPY